MFTQFRNMGEPCGVQQREPQHDADSVVAIIPHPSLDVRVTDFDLEDVDGAALHEARVA